MDKRLEHPFHMYEEIILQPEYLKKLFLTMKDENHHEILSTLKRSERIFLVGCGTSYNAALTSYRLGQTIFKAKNKFIHIPAGELLSPDFELNKQDVVIAFSHSGDTKATFQCLKTTEKLGCKNMLITGNEYSDCSELCQYVLSYGYEKDKSLAHTITYSLSVFLMLILMGKLSREMEDTKTSDNIYALSIQLPLLLKDIISRDPEIKKISEKIKSEFYIICGSENTLGTAAEGALKFGEVHYTPTTFMDIEQLFHGPLVMTNQDSGILVVSNRTDLEIRLNELFEATKNIGCKTVLITSEKNDIKNSDYTFSIPDCHKILAPFMYMIPMQLLSYYLSVNKGLNPDLIRRDQTSYKKARDSYE